MKSKMTIEAKVCFYIVVMMLLIVIILCTSAQAVQEHVEVISTRAHNYQIMVGGSLDEFNTAEYLEAPLSGTNEGHKRLESKFQPNEYLIIENISDINIVNPRIIINGRRNWYSADDILNGLLKPGMTDAEKARAIWSFATSIELQCHENDRRVDDGSITINKELTNPVKWANCYYCSGCQFAASVIVLLCQQAGFDVADTKTSAMGSAHRIAEIFYDGDWHVLDGDERVFHLENDKTTLASYDDVHDNPVLCDRTHSGGFASKGLVRRRGYYYRDNVKGVTSIDRVGRLSTMAMTLRPGEKFQWRWDHIGKWRHGANTRDPLGVLEPYQLANGKMTYEPDLSSAIFPAGSSESSNIHSVLGDGVAQLEPIATSTPAYVIYEVNTPYPAVGGRVGGKFYRETGSDVCRIYVYDPNSTLWVNVWEQANTGVVEQIEIDIDNALDPKPTPAIYQYFVKFELQAQAEADDVFIKEIYIETDVQMSGTALPSLSVGSNNVVYSDESDPGAQVQLTHGWNESSATTPPLTPEAPVSPANGVRVALRTLNKLCWLDANDSDGSIADYHVQVSARQDMLWPVSPNFDRITFSPEPNWPLPCPESWLLQDQTYYWRVRARDNWGAWSNWSDVWSFTVTEKLDGDLDNTWIVDSNDLRLFCKEWLDDCSIEDCNGADFVDNNSVDFGDFVLLALNWLGPYPLTDPNLDMVRWYKFDSTSGTTAYDSSGYGNNGTLAGGAAFEPAGGKSGGAVRLEGGGERVEIPTTSMTAAKGTISMWICAEGDQTLQRDKMLFGCNSDADNRIQLYIGDDKYTRLTLGLGELYEIRENIMTLNTDTWYHVALSWSQTNSPSPGNGDYAVYVNCCKVIEDTYESINTLPSAAHIGNSGDSVPSRGFLGLIDEVRIYDRALSEFEIMQLYKLLQ